MRLPFDVVASLLLGAACVTLLAAHRCASAPSSYRRVMQQGGSFFLGLNLMHAGYWMLQPAVRLCAALGITPAVISWASLVPAVAAAAAAAASHWGVAAWCLLTAALLDVLDGAVARENERSSPAGAVLDSVLDRYAEFIFFAGALVHYRHNMTAQLVVLAALFGSFLISYSTAKAEALHVTPPRGSMKRSDRLTLLIIGTASAPLSLFWLEPTHSRAAWPVLIAVTVIAVLANVSAVQRFITLARHAGPTPARATRSGYANGRDARLSPAALRTDRRMTD